VRTPTYHPWSCLPNAPELRIDSKLFREIVRIHLSLPLPFIAAAAVCIIHTTSNLMAYGTSQVRLCDAEVFKLLNTRPRAQLEFPSPNCRFTVSRVSAEWACAELLCWDFASVRRPSPTSASKIYMKNKRPKELSILNVYGPLWCREAPVAFMSFPLQKYLDNVPKTSPPKK
jgi:hypothetical protein